MKGVSVIESNTFKHLVNIRPNLSATKMQICCLPGTHSVREPEQNAILPGTLEQNENVLTVPTSPHVANM